MTSSARLLQTPAEIAALLAAARRIAVLGIKTEAQAGQPSFDVPAYLQGVGLEVKNAARSMSAELR